MKRQTTGSRKPAPARPAGSNPPTIADVARLAGVSKTTVSSVVNGTSERVGISATTRERVLAVVERCGYVANTMARGLRARQTQSIGLIVPDVLNPFFAGLNESLDNVARSHGHQLLVACSHQDVAIEAQLVARLVSFRVDGLIVASNRDERTLRRTGCSCPVPVVYVDRELAHAGASSVSSENEQGAHAAVSHLLAAGARQVAFLGGLRDFSTGRDRLAGYERALADRGLPLDRSLVACDGWSAENGRQMMRRISARRRGLPEAIFTGSYTILEGALRGLVECFGTIPAQVRIATFDDHPLLDFLPGRITSVRQDTQRMASEAFVIIRRSAEGDPAVEHRRVPTALIVR